MQHSLMVVSVRAKMRRADGRKNVTAAAPKSHTICEIQAVEIDSGGDMRMLGRALLIGSIALTLTRD